MKPSRQLVVFTFAVALGTLLNARGAATKAGAAEPFYVSLPGPTLSYVHLYYGQE